MTDRDMWACAHKVVAMHGLDAEIHAAMRADELLEAGDIAGQRVWLRILARIEDWRTENLPLLLQ